LQPRATQKAQQTRQQILDAALKLFQKKGFESTTMRDVAKEAGLAVGAAYYYFKSKEELVLAFYYETLCSYDDACREVLPQTKDFEKRMKAIMARRFEQLAPSRHFLGVLARTGADPHSPISPFSPETRELRERAIQLFAEVIDGTQIKAPPALRPHLPTLIWVYHLGLLFFWVHDRSPGQQNTMLMMDKSLAAVTRMIKMLNLPLMSSAVKPLIELIEELWTRKA
jgi:AcrR family transcriptional regulator